MASLPPPSAMNSLTALEQFLDQMISSVRAQNQAECQHWLAYMNNQLDQVQAAARFAIQSCSLFNSAVQPNTGNQKSVVDASTQTGDDEEENGHVSTNDSSISSETVNEVVPVPSNISQEESVDVTSSSSASKRLLPSDSDSTSSFSDDDDQPVAAKKTNKQPVKGKRGALPNNSCIQSIIVVHLNCTEPNCQATFKNKDQLRAHLSDHHGLPAYQCVVNECDRRFDYSWQLLVHHKKDHANLDQWPCGLCSPAKSYKSYSNLNKHYYNCHEKGLFKCGAKDCQYSGNVRNKIFSHQQVIRMRKAKSVPDRFRCSAVGCGKSFSIAQSLHRHERMHLQVKPYTCIWPRCSHSCTSEINMIRHIRAVHFKIPATIKEQKKRNILDARDPKNYYKVDRELAARRLAA